METTNKKSFEEFCEAMRDAVSSIMHEDLPLNEVTRSTGETYMGLRGPVRSSDERAISAMADLTHLYEGYECDKLSYEECIKKVVETFNMDIPNFEGIVDNLFDYESVKPKLAVWLVNERNTAPGMVKKHFIADIYCVYAIVIRIDSEASGCIAVKEAFLNEWGVSIEELHKDALLAVRSSDPVVVEPLGNILGMMMGVENVGPSDDDISITFVGNKSGDHGAAVLLYPEISFKLHGEYLVLPSSVHECLMIPANCRDITSLRMMVHEINQTEVSKQDFLSDEVFIFNSDTRELRVAEEADKELEVAI